MKVAMSTGASSKQTRAIGEIDEKDTSPPRLNLHEIELEELKRLRRSRAGHLGDLSRKYKALQEVLSATSEASVIEELADKYDEAFHKFVDVHEACMRLENDEEKRVLMDSAYEGQRDLKWTTEQRLESSKAAKSRVQPVESVSSKSSNVQSFSKGSSRSSSSHKARRKLEKAKIGLQKLEEKHRLQRIFECAEADEERRRKDRQAEFERNLERLEAESNLRKAQVDLLLEDNASQGTVRSDLYNYLDKPISSVGQIPIVNRPVASKFIDKRPIVSVPDRPEIFKTIDKPILSVFDKAEVPKFEQPEIIKLKQPEVIKLKQP